MPAVIGLYRRAPDISLLGKSTCVDSIVDVFGHLVEFGLSGETLAWGEGIRQITNRPGGKSTTPARVAELADALDLGSSAARRGGSSPPSRIRLIAMTYVTKAFVVNSCKG